MTHMGDNWFIITHHNFIDEKLHVKKELLWKFLMTWDEAPEVNINQLVVNLHEIEALTNILPKLLKATKL